MVTCGWGNKGPEQGRRAGLWDAIVRDIEYAKIDGSGISALDVPGSYCMPEEQAPRTVISQSAQSGCAVNTKRSHADLTG